MTNDGPLLAVKLVFYLACTTHVLTSYDEGLAYVEDGFFRLVVAPCYLTSAMSCYSNRKHFQRRDPDQTAQVMTFQTLLCG